MRIPLPPLLAVAVLALAPVAAGARPPHPWPAADAESLESRFPAPSGFARRPAPSGSFAAWLRDLPLHPVGRAVHLWNGALKGNQGAHVAVATLDVGAADLQQCADAVIRLRAEYLYAAEREDAIAFRFTSGDLARWEDWRRGLRPRVRGQNVRWVAAAQPDGSYRSLRRYLDVVFTYAGTDSLARELAPVADPRRIEAGDVFIHPGFPGHAVIVVDVVENAAGARRFLLAQSYMPAQEIEILENPNAPDGASPWYEARRSGPLATPEWPFRYEELRRFKE